MGRLVEWSEKSSGAVGQQFQFPRMSARPYAVGPQRFQAPVRTTPAATSQFVPIQVRLTDNRPPSSPSQQPRAPRLVASGIVDRARIQQVMDWARTDRGGDCSSSIMITPLPTSEPAGVPNAPSDIPFVPGGSLQVGALLTCFSEQNLTTILSILGLQRTAVSARQFASPVRSALRGAEDGNVGAPVPPRSLRGASRVQWLGDGALGYPITLVQGERYRGRWLVDSPNSGLPTDQRGLLFPCDFNPQNIFGPIMAGYSNPIVQSIAPPPSWPALPAGFPQLPQPANACPVFTQGTWNEPTTTFDSSALELLIPAGVQLFDFWNAETGQRLIGPSGGAPPPPLNLCPTGQIRNAAGQCVPGACSANEVMNQEGRCIPSGTQPPPDQTPPAPRKKGGSGAVVVGALALAAVGGAVLLLRR